MSSPGPIGPNFAPTPPGPDDSVAVLPPVTYFTPVEGDKTVRYKFLDRIHEAEFEVIDNDILLVRNALPWMGELTRVCEEFDLWEQAKVIGNDGEIGTDDYARTSPATEVSADADPKLGRSHDLLRGIETLFVQAYQKFVNPRAHVSKGTGYSLLKYSDGQFFREHVDVIPPDLSYVTVSDEGRTTKVTTSVLAHRRLTLTAFWSTDDIEGGDLVFPRQKLRIKPNCGDLIVFPSSFGFPHDAEAVTAGVKYTLVTWFM